MAIDPDVLRRLNEWLHSDVCTLRGKACPCCGVSNRDHKSVVDLGGEPPMVGVACKCGHVYPFLLERLKVHAGIK